MPVNDNNGCKERELFGIDDTPSLFGKSMIGGSSSAVTNDTPFKLPYQTSPRFQEIDPFDCLMSDSEIDDIHEIGYACQSAANSELFEIGENYSRQPKISPNEYDRFIP